MRPNGMRPTGMRPNGMRLKGYGSRERGLKECVLAEWHLHDCHLYITVIFKSPEWLPISFHCPLPVHNDNLSITYNGQLFWTEPFIVTLPVA